MSISVEEPNALAGIVPTGTTRWRDDVPTEQSDVYVISIANEMAEPGIPDHERAFWLPHQTAIYIGRAKQLRRRLDQFRRHVYGRTSHIAEAKQPSLKLCQDDYMGGGRGLCTAEELPSLKRFALKGTYTLRQSCALRKTLKCLSKRTAAVTLAAVTP